MNKMFGLMKFVNEGEMGPPYHGLVYRDFCRRGVWVAPLGLNVLVSLTIQALSFVRIGFLSDRMNGRNWYQQGFDAGVKHERLRAGLDK